MLYHHLQPFLTAKLVHIQSIRQLHPVTGSHLRCSVMIEMTKGNGFDYLITRIDFQFEMPLTQYA